MRSPEKCGYSVGKLCPTAKLWINAVFGPKSLYSGLAIWSLPSAGIERGKHHPRYEDDVSAMSSQSAMLDPSGRVRYKFDRFG